MVKATVELEDKENNIVKAYMLVSRIEDKRVAIKEIIQEYGKSARSIKNILKEIEKGAK